MAEETSQVPVVQPHQETQAISEAPLQPAQGPAVQVDDEPDNDADSALGEDAVSSTASISSSILHYRKENGRTYHAYRDGKYLYPNDEQENERLDLQHHIWYLTLGGKLGVSPPNEPESSPGRVLDIGTGTGIWAIDFGDEHPNADIIGVDLSPIQPSLFQIDDVEDEWTYSHGFDYIHHRAMNACLTDWPAHIKKCYDHLNPGGWLEVQEFGTPTSDDGTLAGTSLAASIEVVGGGAAKFGRGFVDVHSVKDMFAAAGFSAAGVVERRFYWPSNHAWPRDRRHKELGAWNNNNISNGLEAFMLAVGTRGLGWSADDIAVLAAKARADLKDRKIHAYWPM
ncbi:S-adenosyl-L-methionine-dependent methyltransferase [Lasiosphaeria ovina]|uniref:S-adenosyl-L-methionine-dependent methyltransferase n=1 Tax=Lasiosphaeria ovina TaxID=92902 RepID=A0AAE0JYS3_9PEZI|nr:S-adenosyl-L-methionine-dependent methyltransferase [Lasiosphaeria ovina]